MANLLAFYEDLEVGAESRFFLQALICREQALLTASFKVKPVARLLCLTDRLVRDAVRELAEAGLLVAKTG